MEYEGSDMMEGPMEGYTEGEMEYEQMD